jgi:hypothetical protein
VSVFRIWHRVYDVYWSPDAPKGAMVMFKAAATWEDEREARRVADELNADNP